MATVDEVIQRLQESKPPATDSFTYLTIVEQSLSPAVLPTLQDILEDAQLTNDIGWDLVEMLIKIPGSATCLETVARLGNPREVIIKVLEALETDGSDETELQEEGTVSDSRFVTLVGMLKLLHRRLKVSSPSRFLHTTLQTVLQAYNPKAADGTAAVIDFLRSLSGRNRPPLPTRQSSTKLDGPFQASDPSKSAPDPEATTQANAGEDEQVNKLLQAFVTCVLESYVNSNSLEWASRLLEYYSPERIVPGRKTMMQAFKEVSELQAMDALVGQLVAVASDLGLSNVSVKDLLASPISKSPLADEPDSEEFETGNISTGGFLCFTAYRMFALPVFDADYDQPNIHIFPDHHNALKNFLGDEPQAQITENPGTVEALIVMALWLNDEKRVVSPEAEKDANFMSYHHLLTLISVFHPSLRTRNAATNLAGLILHVDPQEDDRLAILEDLLENCMFSSLQACAVTWLRDEIVAAHKNGQSGRFASPTCLDALQYTMFQDLAHLEEMDAEGLYAYWVQNSPMHLQVANFALFLFGGKDYKELVPAGMPAAVEHRYVNPLLAASKRLKEAIEKKEVDGGGSENEVLMQLDILTDILQRVPLQ